MIVNQEIAGSNPASSAIINKGYKKMESISDRWERVTEQGSIMCQFINVVPKLCCRADLHAFMRLNEWFPPAEAPARSDDVVTGVDHDQIYLFPTEEQVESLTDEQILELSRCGVFLDGEVDCLSMFV